MKIRIGLLAIAIAFASCKQQGGTSTEEQNPKEQNPNRLPNAPKEIEAILAKEFPGVMASPDISDSIIHYLKTKYGILPNKILLGASTCVDDIIYTKNFHLHPEIKGPFHLGGLAGLPFTGVSGIAAFAHHIPDSGTMLLVVEPHIGYSEKAGWGYVLRHEQPEPSLCCGALMGTLEKLQKGKLRAQITEEDYQGDKIGEMALAHRKEILETKNPIIELTKLTSISAAEQIRKHVLDEDLAHAHVKYVIIVTGILIDTDYAFCDYQSCDHISIYDVSKKKFVEELDNKK